ncbi:MAG: hypothetical protein KJT03_13810, partial [Verrucomicrobiae bacterium]|nr:hypothetical protein [Verrucomicrobiae bacterium]
MEKEASQTQTKPVTLLGVEYTHIHTEEGGDLYLTRYGLPFMEQLKPENWKADSWFKENRESLPGTSNVYKLPTKSVQGRSLDLVVKYCRVGEDVPLDTMGFDKFWFAEFNTPYEEFSLVMEMRQASAPHNRILTHKPLAIYVPPERLQLWQTGRSKHRIARKTSKFRDIELDIYRQYIMIYEWIKGVSAPEAVKLLERDAALEREVTDLGDALRDLTIETRKRMMESGFMVIDHKPAHIILRPLKGGKLLRRSSGEYAFAL